ncbi:MAG: hypothetical protein WCI04_01140 [archaeon]
MVSPVLDQSVIDQGVAVFQAAFVAVVCTGGDELGTNGELVAGVAGAMGLVHPKSNNPINNIPKISPIFFNITPIQL